jgi:hypothetical protein
VAFLSALASGTQKKSAASFQLPFYGEQPGFLDPLLELRLQLIDQVVALAFRIALLLPPRRLL